MKFIVRYWSSLLPEEYISSRVCRTPDGCHFWVDYSIHPASKLGLHNALLAAHDRNEILALHGGRFECAVFVVEGGGVDRLSAEAADALFATLPRGEVKWLTIHDFLLPHVMGEAPDATASGEAKGFQLSLFEHVHTPYDDLDEKPHSLDIDV